MSHTKALNQRERGMRAVQYLHVRWFLLSLFCKLLFAVVFVVVASERTLNRTLFTVIFEGFFKFHHLVGSHAQLKSCGKRFSLTSNLSFNVVDVWMAFQRHKNSLSSWKVFSTTMWFVCAEKTKRVKTIVKIRELYAATTFSVIGICAPRAISLLMNEVVEPRFFSNSNKQTLMWVYIAWLRN